MSARLSTRRSYIELHIAVVLWGFTAILGKWIQLPAIDLVWWRVGITAVSLLYLVRWGRSILSLSTSTIVTFAAIGVIVGLHWVTFYGAVKLANASITLLCMATTSLFAAIIEPIVNREPPRILDIVLSVLIIPAMALVGKTLDHGMLIGAAVGLLSAALAATFSVLNKKHIQRADPYTITFIELGSAFLFLTVVMSVDTWGRAARYSMPPSTIDWVLIIVLALLCTTLTFVLSLRALTGLSAFASTLVVNLEPVYGILLAALLLGEHEQLSATFYVGAAVVLIIVLTYPLLSRRFNSPTTSNTISHDG